MADIRTRNREKGRLGEGIAVKYIEKQGFSVVSRNYQKAWGELDIIAVKDGLIHFFEVKSVTCDLRHLSSSHRPEENVNAFKIGQIRRMIKTYLYEKRFSSDKEFKFHVLCVFMDMHVRRARIRWLRDIIL